VRRVKRALAELAPQLAARQADMHALETVRDELAEKQKKAATASVELSRLLVRASLATESAGCPMVGQRAWAACMPQGARVNGARQGAGQGRHSRHGAGPPADACAPGGLWAEGVQQAHRPSG